jgi:hypothetical protein
MKKKYLFLSFMMMQIILVFNNCNRNDESALNAQIQIIPEQILLNDYDTVTLYISVQPPVATNWAAIATPSNLINIYPASGKLNRDIFELEITVASGAFPDGIHNGVIEIISDNAGKAVSQMVVAINPKPIAKVNTEQIVFIETLESQVLTISNSGSGFLNWQFNPNVSWLSFQPQSGTLAFDESIAVKVSVERAGLPVGIEETEVQLISNSVDVNPSVTFTAHVPAYVEFQMSVDEIYFGYFQDEKMLNLSNIGNIGSEWNVVNDSEYLLFSPAMGTLLPGEDVQISIYIDRTNLQTGTFFSNLVFSDKQGHHKDLSVVTDNFIEDKWLIDGIVIDAEYDRGNDLLILALTAPNEIRKYNLAEQLVHSVDVQLPPTALSISFDGNYAVVGHQQGVSLVNLNTMQLVQLFSVSSNVYDIVIAPNNWAYIFPESGQFVRIECLTLANGTYTPHTGNSIRHKTKAKLHPSGDYIYITNGDSSPTNFIKIDIRNDTAVYLYRSPYHGHVGFGKNIWISDTGNKLFAESRNVFTSSIQQAYDMIYIDNLNGSGSFATLDNHSSANRIYAISTLGPVYTSYPDKNIRIYIESSNEFIGLLPLPGFVFPDGHGSGTYFESEGHFGFFNNSGTKYHVVVKARPGSDFVNDWAIASINVE